MKKQLLLLLSFVLSLNVISQQFVNDSLMEIYLESGAANKNFRAEGKTIDNKRIGKWTDYTFEFVITYHEVNDETTSRGEHLLIQSTGKYFKNEKSGVWKFYAVEAETFDKYHIADVTFKNGVLEGAFTYYFSTGEKAAESNYKNGKADGVVKEYYKSGELAQKYFLVENIVQSTHIIFFKSGNIKSKVNYIDNLREGVEVKFYENGNMRQKRFYINDNLEGDSEIFYPSGKVQELAIYDKNKVKQIKYYYESGQLWVSKVYQDEKYYNVLELYDSEGKPLDFGTLKDGNGTVKYYNHNAEVYRIRTFKNGKIVKDEEVSEAPEGFTKGD